MCLLVNIQSPMSNTHAFAATCAASEYKQFDFWIGDWDVVDAGKPDVVAARVRVDRMLDGCALHEQYQDATGLRGESFTVYDAARRVWHQSWVTNRGQFLAIEGALHGSTMILTGADPTKGPSGRVRGTWTPIREGVREVAVTSSDGGKTWTPWFDLIFRRRADR